MFGAPHHLFFCNSFVQNKVTEIVAPVLGGLEYKMTFLLQGLRGGGRGHPVCSDIHAVESPHHKLAILGLKGIKWGRGGGRWKQNVNPSLSGAGPTGPWPIPGITRRNAGREKCACNHSTQIHKRVRK